MKHRGLFRHRI